MHYFDYASSTPIDEEILDSYSKLLSKYFANSSAIHSLGLVSNELLEKSRKQIADILHIKDSEVIFTSGASESNNMAIKGVAFKYKNRGNHLITSFIEHPSVLNVFKYLEKEFNYKVDYLKPNSEGKITIEELKKYIDDKTILVSIMMVNNETGAINNVDQIGKFIKENFKNTFFHCDATQGFGKLNLSLENIDLLSMSAHKIYGLKGSGLLVKKEKVSLDPLIIGGEQEFTLRAGTSNFPLDAMLAKTIRLAYESKDSNYEYISKLNKRLREGISNNKFITINSPIDASPYILNISLGDIKSAIMMEYLQSKDILVSATSACGARKNAYSYVIEEQYPSSNRSISSFRISLSKFNTIEDIDLLIKALNEAKENII